MRELIRTTLINAVADLKDVVEPHVAGPDSLKPYAVVQEGNDTDDEQWLGFRRIIEVWPFLDRTSFTDVDVLNKKIIKALDKQLLTDSTTGEAFSCVYLGSTGQDEVIEDWDAITRGLKFAVMAVQPVAIDAQVILDSWVAALADWTSLQLGEGWTVYQNQWPLGYKRPSVLWRLSDWGMDTVARSGFKVRKSLVCHVLGLSANDEMQAATKIVTEMANAIKVPLDIQARMYLTVEQPRVDYKVDALQRGQITVSLSRNSSRPQEDIPVMGVVGSTGSLS